MHFFRKVTYFVKNAAKPVLPRLCGVRFLGYFVLKLIIDFFGGVLYTVTKPFFDIFRKVRNFAKFFCKKRTPMAFFCGNPLKMKTLRRTLPDSFNDSNGHCVIST